PGRGHRPVRRPRFWSTTGRGSGAARPRDPCTFRRSGRRDAPAWVSHTAGRSRGAAPRSRAWRGACRDATWTFSSSGRPRPASLAETVFERLQGGPAGVAVLLLVDVRVTTSSAGIRSGTGR